MCFFFFQAEDGIRDLVRSRGLGDVYKRQDPDFIENEMIQSPENFTASSGLRFILGNGNHVDIDGSNHESNNICLLYTSDAADERSSVDLGGRRIIKKKTKL